MLSHVAFGLAAAPAHSRVGLARATTPRRRAPCASAKSPKKPTRKAEDAAGAGPATLGNAPAGDPKVNSAVMQAMGDYFGDDGRELEDYLKRPRNAAGKVMLRVLIVGARDGEVRLAERLAASERARGVYYCTEEDGKESEAMNKFATCSTVSYTDKGEEGVEKFCLWACVDAMFVGPEHGGSVEAKTEATLAENGVTVFSHDVSDAVASGEMSVDDCFSAMSEELDAVAPPPEQLVE